MRKQLLSSGPPGGLARPPARPPARGRGSVSSGRVLRTCPRESGHGWLLSIRLVIDTTQTSVCCRHTCVRGPKCMCLCICNRCTYLTYTRVSGTLKIMGVPVPSREGVPSEASLLPQGPRAGSCFPRHARAGPGRRRSCCYAPQPEGAPGLAGEGRAEEHPRPAPRHGFSRSFLSVTSLSFV